MRQFAGFGTAEETNERFRYLLDHGQTGLSTAFDMPSLMGHDSDHPRSLGEVGREGVAVDTLDDMETLFAGDRPRRGQRVDDDQRAGGDHDGLLRRRGGGEGHPGRPPGRHDPGRHPQGVHRPEGVVFPGRSGDAAARGHDAVVDRAHAALAPGLDLAATTSARRARPPPRSWRSRSRTASPTSRSRSARGMDVDDFAPRLSLLLQRAHRLLRGDRQVPRGAPDLGARAARHVRRRRTRSRG